MKESLFLTQLSERYTLGETNGLNGETLSGGLNNNVERSDEDHVYINRVPRSSLGS